MVFDFMKMKIGIVGLGFVGNAIHKSLDDMLCVTIDLDPSKGCSGTYQDLMDADAVFVCVPSPSNADGSCDSSILESVLENLKDYKGVIISKVTATPDVYDRLSSQYHNLVYVPEFLTAANAVNDYQQTRYFIIGGSNKVYQREAERILRSSHPDAFTVFADIKSASLTKYITNSFLATKVVFMNEMAELSANLDLDWITVARLVRLDNRIGESHMQVPGPDGLKGFGGMCFPKDTSALLQHAEQMNASLHVLKESVKKNTLLRLTKPK